MIWLCVVSVLTVVAASASIWATIEDRREIRTGRPSFETLVSYTGIWRRDTFIEVLGEPDTMDCFALPKDKIHELPVSWWYRFFDSTPADVTSMILSVAAPICWTQNRTMAIACVAAGAGAQAIGYAIATIVTYRSGVWRKWLREAQP